MPLYLVKAIVEVQDSYATRTLVEYRLVEASSYIKAEEIFQEKAVPQIRSQHYGAWIDNITALETIRENT
jgi:hypothetical protein